MVRFIFGAPGAGEERAPGEPRAFREQSITIFLLSWSLSAALEPIHRGGETEHAHE